MIFLYRVVTNFLYPILIFLIYLRKIKGKEHQYRYKEKIFAKNFNVLKISNSKLIWFHAASIGELKSIIPVLEELNKRKENLEFLITTVTLSSSIIAKEELKKIKNAKHRFFPIDVNFIIKKFISLWKPDAIFLVDSEIWPNLILCAKEKKIPLGLLNARITNKSFKKWKLIDQFAVKIFSAFDICISSNLETSKYLESFKAKNIINSGNLKLVGKISKDKIENNNENLLSKKKFWFAASTHEGEEKILLEAHLEIKKKFSEILTIIAPRHINRSDDIKKLCDKFQIKSQILKKNDLIDSEKEVIIINSFGVLSEYFKYAKSVFIGKSLVKSLHQNSGQNPIDAAKLGCKIYHGPYVYNFQEIYEMLAQNKISQLVNNSNELTIKLLSDFKNFVYEKKNNSSFLDILGQQTLDNNMKSINNFLFNENN